jgi:hypothetical protein
LKERLNADGALPCYANGAISFSLKGVHVKVQVKWNFQAPEGGGDTHFSVMRGSRASVFIRQGKEQRYKPELYVEPALGTDVATLEDALARAIVRLQTSYPGLAFEKTGTGWRIVIPGKYRIGHEAHFGQVMERYLRFLVESRLPAWETPNMLAKYRTTIGALELARQSAPPKDALVLFDGSNFSQWTGSSGEPVRWTIDDGAMTIVPGTGSIVTKRAYRNFKLHVEFCLPDPPVERVRSNSGVYLQRRYEIQILDSFGLGTTESGCGALYRVRAPDRNMCKKPGEWQTFDIVFHAPHWTDIDGRLKKVKNARISVRHNGALVHKDAELPDKTGAGRPEGPEPGPILLQDHGFAVQFRNIWIVPLD